MKGSTIYLYTDGSVNKEKTLGGWAFGICKEENGELIHTDYGVVEGTHNTAEVGAIVNGLNYIYANLRDVNKVIIYSDSQYAVDPIYFDSLRIWESNGWRTQSNSPVKNLSTWQGMAKILQVMKHRKISVDARWVRGHNGNVNNERMDKLAKRAVSEKRLNELYA